MEKINAWTVYDEGQLAELEKLNAEYMDFLSRGKTERECAKIAVGMAEAAGYRNLDDIIAKGESLKAGQGVCREHGKGCHSFYRGYKVD